MAPSYATTGTCAAVALATIAAPACAVYGLTTITDAPLVSADSACCSWVASEPWALLAMTLIDGSSAFTAAMKYGLSFVSNRSAQVEHGIRNAIVLFEAFTGAEAVPDV